MRVFKSVGTGCIMNFDEDLSEEQIQKRLGFFGGNWIEEKSEELPNGQN